MDAKKWIIGYMVMQKKSDLKIFSKPRWRNPVNALVSNRNFKKTRPFGHPGSNPGLGVYSFINLSIRLAKAGLVTNTPIVIPAIVVNAKPLTKPAPAFQSGIMATTVAA